MQKIRLITFGPKRDEAASSQYHDTRLARPPNLPIRSYRVEMPPKLKLKLKLMTRDTAKMPRNPAEGALWRLTYTGLKQDLHRLLFEEQVLARLDPTERGMLRLANKDLRRVVHRSDLGWTFKVSDFVGSVERFEWALKHKILESSILCTLLRAIIEGGNLDVLKRAELAIRVHAPGFELTLEGNLIWTALTQAAAGGHLECVVYLRERGCKMTPNVSKETVNNAFMHVLRWVIENGYRWDPQWTLDQLEQIDDPHATSVGACHAHHIENGTVHENFCADLQWVIQRAHQQITDDRLAAEEKQRRKDMKERRAAKKRKAA